MPLVSPESGAREMLRLLFYEEPITVITLEVGLWVDEDFEPNRFTNFDEITEATFGGYARVQVNRDPWRNAITDEEGRAATRYLGARPTFEADGTSAQTIYGHFVINPATEAIWWIEKWEVPRVLEFEGDAVKILMPLTLTSVYPKPTPDEG